MMSNSCTVWTCTHAHNIHDTLEKNLVVSKPYRCGACSENFSAICLLHTHLKGGSYHYEAETMTAIPVDKLSCLTEYEGEEPDVAEQTEKYFKVYKMRKRKQDEEPSSQISLIKVIEDPKQNVKEKSASITNSLDMPDRDVKSQIVEKEPTYHERQDETFKMRIDLENSLKEENGQEKQSDVTKVRSNDDQEHSHNQTTAEANDMEITADDKKRDAMNRKLTVGGSELLHQEDNAFVVVEPVESNVEIQTVYYELESSNLEDTIQMIPTVDDRKEIHQSEMQYGDSSKHDSSVLDNQKMQDTPTSVIESIQRTEDEDIDLEQAVAAFDKSSATLSNDKQLIITVYGVETSPDGTVQVVVGEKDGEVFDTPAGLELFKALKSQAKDIPSGGSTKVVFNYSDMYPNRLINSDSAVNSKLPDNIVGQYSCIDSEAAAHNLLKRQKRNEKDDSCLPKFRIQLSNTPSESAEQGFKPIVFKEVQEKLSTAEALNILTECNFGMHADKISKTQPLRAKGGELYVVDLEALPHKKDCRYDDYLWVNCVTRKFPGKHPVMNRHIFKIRLPDRQFSDAFQKHICQFIEEARYSLIHYIGHESVFQPLAHGNCKTGAVFKRTCPSVLQELRALSKEDGVTANKLFKQVESLKLPDGIKGVKIPRSLGQIKNHLRWAKRTSEKEKAKNQEIDDYFQDV